MIAKFEEIFADGFSVNALIEAITVLVEAILKYVAGEEGYEF